MSRVAHEFWNHKRIAQAEARQRLKALGILTGDEVQKPLIVVDKNVPAGTLYGLSSKSPLMDLILKKGRAVGPSA